MALGAAGARVQAGASRGPLYCGPNSGEGAGPAPPLWAARAAPRAIGLLITPELKGAGGGLWGGIIIRGQIARLPARLESWAGMRGTARAKRAPSLPADVQQLEARARQGARSLVPRGRAGARLCGAGTMPLTLGCPLCARPRRPPLDRAATAPSRSEPAEATRGWPAPALQSRPARASARSPAAAPPPALGRARPGSDQRALRPGRKHFGAAVSDASA